MIIYYRWALPSEVLGKILSLCFAAEGVRISEASPGFSTSGRSIPPLPFLGAVVFSSLGMNTEAAY